MGVMVPSVLVGLGVTQQMLVRGGHDAEVVVGIVELVLLLVDAAVSRQPHQFCVWVLLIDLPDVGSPEMQHMDFMADIDAFHQVLHHRPDVNGLVGVATDVEVPRHFLHGETAIDPASLLVHQCLLHDLHLLVGVVRLEDLEVSGINVVALCCQPVFLDGGNVGVMGQHDILQVEGEELTGKSWEFDIQGNADSNSLYVIYYLVSKLFEPKVDRYSG